MGQFFFTSDHHWGHRNILKFDNRPWNCLVEHDKALIDNWNAVVTNEDTVYHLGDFSYKCSAKYAIEIASQLNGKQIHLLQGNHDKGRNEAIAEAFPERFIDHGPYLDVKCEDTWLVLCHYPIESWNWQYHGSLHCHGHCHGKARPLKNRLEVCVNIKGYDYAPIPLAEVKELIEKQSK